MTALAVGLQDQANLLVEADRISRGRLGRAKRSEYFDVACCPANLARLLEQVPSLVYAQTDDTLFVNLSATVVNGCITQSTGVMVVKVPNIKSN